MKESFTLSIDVRSALLDLYPGLDKDKVELIAADIVRRWDYSPQYELIQEKAEDVALYANIVLNEDAS
jgi:hypothetical protein